MSEHVRQQIQLCLGRLHGGAHAAAVEHGGIALRAAEQTSAPPLIAEAAWAFGCALTSAGATDDALRRLRRALAMAQRAGPEGRPLLARIHVAIGSAHLAAGQAEEARHSLLAALAEQGEADAARAKTWIELAGVEELAGDVRAAAAYLEDARAHARARVALALTPDDRAEANLDLATAASNRARARIVNGELPAAGEDLREATEAVGRIHADGYRAGPVLLHAINGYWSAIVERTDDPGLRGFAEAARGSLAPSG
jgi:hypothetical protein